MARSAGKGRADETRPGIVLFESKLRGAERKCESVMLMAWAWALRDKSKRAVAGSEAEGKSGGAPAD
jgi:hypothetical protein